jgi:hypothetical protein
VQAERAASCSVSKHVIWNPNISVPVNNAGGRSGSKAKVDQIRKPSWSFRKGRREKNKDKE